MKHRSRAEVKIEGTDTTATRLDVHRDQPLVFHLVCADSPIDRYLCVGQVRNWFIFEHILVHLEMKSCNKKKNASCNFAVSVRTLLENL